MLRVRNGLANAALVMVGAMLVLSACGGGGGGGGAAPANHNVTISWNANHEKGVNSSGGGYTVTISGKTPIDVPFVSGATAPTSTVVTLYTGSYTATVKAYAALDSSGGTTGSTSASSASLAIVVP